MGEDGWAVPASTLAFESDWAVRVLFQATDGSEDGWAVPVSTEVYGSDWAVPVIFMTTSGSEDGWAVPSLLWSTR